MAYILMAYIYIRYHWSSVRSWPMHSSAARLSAGSQPDRCVTADFAFRMFIGNFSRSPDAEPSAILLVQPCDGCWALDGLISQAHAARFAVLRRARNPRVGHLHPLVERTFQPLSARIGERDLDMQRIRHSNSAAKQPARLRLVCP